MTRAAAIIACVCLPCSCSKAVLPERPVSLAASPARDLRLALILEDPSRDEGLTASLREGFKSVIVVENTQQGKATQADLLGTVGAAGDLALIGPDLEPVDTLARPRLREALLASSNLAAFADSVKRKPRPARPRKPQAQAPAPDADVPAYKNAEQPDDVALIIGAAGAAQEDIEAVRAHLAALGFPERNTILLAGESATRAAIADSVESRLPKNVRRRSRVFLYYAGNGAGDPESGLAYLLPWDADPRFLATTAYPVKRLFEKLDSLIAREVAVVLDAGLPETETPKGKLTALTAPGGEPGRLTRRLLEALNQTQGAVGMRELLRTLR